MDALSFIIIVIFFVIVFVIFRGKRKEQKLAEQRQLQKRLVLDAENFLASVRRQKFFTTIISSTPLDTMLEKGEKIILDEKTRLFEPRAIRRNVGIGVRSRVTKGISLGTWTSQGESHQEWRKIDTGRIVLTNERIIFNGAIEHRIISVDKVISMHPYTDGIEIGSKSRSKSMIFFLENSFIWGTAINILHSIKDLSDLRTLDFSPASDWLNNYHVEEGEK
jgi:hypothetical protein